MKTLEKSASANRAGRFSKPLYSRPWQYCLRRVYARAREAHEARQSCGRTFDRSRPHAAELRADAETSRSMEKNMPFGRSRKTDHLSSFLSGRAPKHLVRGVHDHYFNPHGEGFAPRTLWSLSNAFTSAFKNLDPVSQFNVTAELAHFLELATRIPGPRQ